MASGFYENHSLTYQNLTVKVDPSVFLSILARSLRENAQVLDIGCGSGRDLLWLKERGFRPTGFERSLSLAECARQHSGCPVIAGDFTKFKFSDFQFDAIILIGALVHLQHAEIAPTLGAISKAVRDDGLIYITLKEGTGSTRNDDGRIFFLWNRPNLEIIFHTLGFIILDFSRNQSTVNQKDMWLGYLLKIPGK